MKLSAFIAAAAVIGGSFLIPVPAEARNGWVKIHCDRNDECTYQKIIKRSGSIVTVLTQSKNGRFTEEKNCSTWAYRFVNSNGSKDPWDDVMPGSIGEMEQENACR